MAEDTATPLPVFTREQGMHVHLWQRGLIIGLTLLVWLTVSGMVLWGLSKIGSALTLLLVSMLVAYSIHPLVRLLQRFLPRVVAVALVYVGILGGILVLLYFIVFTAMVQLLQIAQQLQRNLPHLLNYLKPFLERIGLSASSLQMSSQWLTNQLLVVVGSIQPLLFNIFAVVLSSILVITLSVYFVLDGQQLRAGCVSIPLSLYVHASRFSWTRSIARWAVLFVANSFWESSSARYRPSDCFSLAFPISFS